MKKIYSYGTSKRLFASLSMRRSRSGFSSMRVASSVSAADVWRVDIETICDIPAVADGMFYCPSMGVAVPGTTA